MFLIKQVKAAHSKYIGRKPEADTFFISQIYICVICLAVQPRPGTENVLDYPDAVTQEYKLSQASSMS